MTWNAFKGQAILPGCGIQEQRQRIRKAHGFATARAVPLKVAVGGIKAPMDRLAEHGWQVVDGPQTSLTPQQYQEFIVESRGEISPAKHVYVAMRSGWFSCRSACYLAGGRPVVVQDTGFSKFYRPEKGFCHSLPWKKR